MRVIELHRRTPVLSVLFSADGRHLAVSQAGSVLILDPLAGERPLHAFDSSELGGHTRSYWRISSALPNGQFLVRTGTRVVRIDPHVGAAVPVVLDQPTDRRVNTFALSADGEYAVAGLGQRGEGFRLWRVGAADHAKVVWDTPDTPGVVRPVIGFAPGGGWFAAAGRVPRYLVASGGGPILTPRTPGGLVMHSLQSGTRTHLVPSPSSDPKRVLVTPDDGHVLVFAMASFNCYPADNPGRRVGRVVNPGMRKISGAAVHPTGRQVVTVSYDALSRVYDLPGLQEVNCYGWNVGPMLGVAYSPDGTLCAAVGVRGRVIVWDCDR